MKKKILLLGSSGKMGSAIKFVFRNNYILDCKTSKDFNASDLPSIKKIVNKSQPDIIINTVAFLGIDPSEKAPELAYRINCLYPKVLAEEAANRNCLLIHFSTDAVFDNSKQSEYFESDQPKPLNVYGLTKYGGDCFIQAKANKYYIARISILFGPTYKNDQFFEKMLALAVKAKTGIRVANDIVASPCYSFDVANRLRQIIENQLPYGLYHISNTGTASLFQFFSSVIENLNLPCTIQSASYRDFPHVGIKNTYTPLSSEKIDGMRHWHQAVIDYCDSIQLGEKIDA